MTNPRYRLFAGSMTLLVLAAYGCGGGDDSAKPCKVTGALKVVSPGAEKIDEVSGTPSLVWG